MNDARARAAAKITSRGADPAQPGLAVSRIRPAYQQVADQLRELIVNGTLSPGDRLPAKPSWPRCSA